MASGSGTAAYGNTVIVNPTDTHKATIVWLHDIGETGLDSAQFVEKLKLKNIKWICPTAPIRHVSSLGGAATTAWFDVAYTSENMHGELVSVNTVVSFVLNLFSNEPGHVKKGLGGIGLGAAEALYFGSKYAFEWIPIDLKVVVGLNGWLPGMRSFNDNLGAIPGIVNRAASLPILLTNESNSNVSLAFGGRCANNLRTAGFPIFFTSEKDNSYVRNWLKTYLEL